MQNKPFPSRLRWSTPLFGILLISVIVSFAPATKNELLDAILHSMQPTVFVEAQTYATSRPTANPDAVTTPFNTPIDIQPLTNDVNPITIPLRVTFVTNPSAGSINVNNTTNVVTFTPAPGFVGTVIMNYGISNTIRSDQSTITVTVQPNQPPVANNDSATTTYDSAVNINVPANDTDSDGALNLTSVAVVTGPTRGTLNVNPATGVVTYTPNPNNNPDPSNADSFTYTIQDDNEATSNVATVNLTITRPPVSLAPQADPVTPAAPTATSAAPAVNLVRSGALSKENITLYGGVAALIAAAVGVWLSIARHNRDQE